MNSEVKQMFDVKQNLRSRKCQYISTSVGKHLYLSQGTSAVMVQQLSKST